MAVTIFDARIDAPGTTRATVLFVDLRGYTGLAERLAPAELVPLLDELFAALTSSTAGHGGQVYHVAGDGMMAGFGALSGASPGCSGASEALAAGRAMLERFETIAARWRDELSIEAGIGIGVHLGEVAEARLGPPGREATTLLGDTVNVAARLCSRARAGEILFSAAVADALEPPAGAAAGAPPACVRLPKFQVRGRAAPIDIWCVPASERLAL